MPSSQARRRTAGAAIGFSSATRAAGAGLAVGSAGGLGGGEGSAHAAGFGAGRSCVATSGASASAGAMALPLISNTASEAPNYRLCGLTVAVRVHPERRPPYRPG